MAAARRRPSATSDDSGLPPRSASNPAAANNKRAASTVDRDRLRVLLTPVVDAEHLELEDIEVRAAGRRRIVRVVVDGEQRVSLDQVAVVARAVSDALDESDLLGDTPYTLEVSSPGVDRPLLLPRHWRRNIGRLVTVTPHSGAEVTGRITSADDSGAELDLEPGLRTVAYATVARALVQVEFRSTTAEDLDEMDLPPEDADDLAATGADGALIDEVSTGGADVPTGKES